MRRVRMLAARAPVMSGPKYKSAFGSESEDWTRENIRAEEGRWIRERQWCRCRKPVEGPMYLKHRSCRACGKLHKQGRL